MNIACKHHTTTTPQDKAAEEPLIHLPEKLSNTEPQTAVLQKNKTFSLQVFCACGSPEIRVNFLYSITQEDEHTWCYLK